MSEEITPPSETFRHYGQKVRVVMTLPTPEFVATFYAPDPEVLLVQTNPIDLLHFFPVTYPVTEPPSGLENVAEPTVGFAVWCPAKFTVEGLPYAVEFSIFPGRSRRHPIGVTGLHVGVDPSGGGEVTRELLGSVPVARLLAAALNAAAVTVLHYPVGYDGPAHRIGDGGALLPTEDRIVNEMGMPCPFPVAMHHGPLPATFAKSAAGVPELSGHRRLTEVARIVRDAERDGLPFETRVMTRFSVGERQARRLVQEARAEGFLPAPSRTNTRTQPTTASTKSPRRR